MDWQAISQALYDRNDVRCRKLNRKVQLHIRNKKKFAHVLSNLAGIQKFRKARVAVAIDCEWNPKRPITEIGVTVRRDGEVKSYNVSITRQSTFLYGDSHKMTDADARDWLRDMLKDAEVVVGHAIRNDVMQLQKWGFGMPDCHRIDTAKWSRVVFRSPNSVNLKRLAAHYGIEHDHAHCAGNDSHVTMRVAHAINDQFAECA